MVCERLRVGFAIAIDDGCAESTGLMNEDADEAMGPGAARTASGIISGNKSSTPLLSSARLGELSSNASSFQMEFVEKRDPDLARRADASEGMFAVFKSSRGASGISIGTLLDTMLGVEPTE